MFAFVISTSLLMSSYFSHKSEPIQQAVSMMRMSTIVVISLMYLGVRMEMLSDGLATLCY